MTDDSLMSDPPQRWAVILRWLKDFRVRALLALIVIGAVIFLARDHYHFLEDGWRALLQANNWYILAAVTAMGLSMIAQSEVMVGLLRSAGVSVKRTSANALGLSANAWSSSFPGGPAISAAMIFRGQMKWGATAVVASWYLVISGVLSGASMALLGLGAMFFLQAKVHVFSLSLSLLALVALLLAVRWVGRNPIKVQSFLMAGMSWFNRKRRKPADRYHDEIRGFSDQLRTVDLPARSLIYAILFSLLNWILEIVCLFLCILAVGAEPNVSGAILAFIGAKLVGQAPVTPGGLGTVDITLTTMLVGFAGLSSGESVASVIVFRMVSFALLTIVGWLVFLWSFAVPKENEGHPESIISWQAPKSADISEERSGNNGSSREQDRMIEDQIDIRSNQKRPRSEGEGST